MFNGIEVDMLSLGDADCTVVTQWVNNFPHRILIDGGRGSDAPAILDFLHSRGYKNFWAAVCTHLHRDHARGLIKLVQDKSLHFTNGWMHNIRKHISADALRSASAGSSSQAEGVRKVLESTDELARAFASRNLTPQEPFANSSIAAFPAMTVLGPSVPFYQSALRQFTKARLTPSPNFYSEALSAINSAGSAPRLRTLADLLNVSPGSIYGPVPSALTPPPALGGSLASLMSGVLENSSVKEDPSTQPYNETSVILGVDFDGKRFLFTGDAGSKALDCIPAEWTNLWWMQVPHHGSDDNLSQNNIERFCPRVAYISACGDSSHPSKTIVNGLIKVGADVFSTHSPTPGHLWSRSGAVPPRADYVAAAPLRGVAEPVIPSLSWLSRLHASK
jgi:beta-lactamase superfamily II metal-dependent hydrolase